CHRSRATNRRNVRPVLTHSNSGRTRTAQRSPPYSRANEHTSSRQSAMDNFSFSRSEKGSPRSTPACTVSSAAGVFTPFDSLKFPPKSADLSGSSSSSESVGEEHGDGYYHDGKFERHHGLNWFVTGLFVVGDLAGGGLVALPTAMIQSYFWIGLGLTLLMSVIVCYTAYVLGQCWVILLRRWPEYRSHCRKPYAELGYRALGPKMRTTVSICLNVTQFGIAVVYLLLSAKNIHDFLQWAAGVEINFCIVILVVAAGLLPVTFLKSPQDFWGAVVLAMFTTSLAVVLICVGAILDFKTCNP
ncbi:Protein Y32F6A.4, partial [Aphelenchoides avenae]